MKHRVLEYFKARRKIPLLRELCMARKTIYIRFLKSAPREAPAPSWNTWCSSPSESERESRQKFQLVPNSICKLREFLRPPAGVTEHRRDLQSAHASLESQSG